MKKWFSIVLSLALVLAVFTSCSGPAPAQSEASQKDPASTGAEESAELPVLRVCVDFPSVNSQESQAFLSSVPGNGSEFTLLLESLPRGDSPNRKTELTRIRTEILAGKGPDVFLCACYSPFTYTAMGDEATGLFPFPRQAMENRIFLPLDEYIEKAEYMEWDKLLPNIMEAGRNDEGQQVLPLAYDMWIILLEKDAYTPSFDLSPTWDDLAASSDPTARMLAQNTRVYSIMGDVADYENDKLSISEEDMLDCFRRYRDQGSLSQEETPAPYVFAQITDGHITALDNSSVPLDDDAPEYWMLGEYNTTGGCTAGVSSMAAINRNTPYPQQAFRVLDRLLDKSTQGNHPLYAHLHALPVHSELYSQDAPQHGQSMSAANFQAYCELREQISVVKFNTPLDHCMIEVVRNCAPGQEGQLPSLVHEQYMKMNMMLAES